MFGAVLVRRALESMAIFHLFTRVESISNAGEEKIGTLLDAVAIESRVNMLRYRSIEIAMRRHLDNYEGENSRIHLFLHPKANPRVSEVVARICSEQVATIVWAEKDRHVDQSCNRTETCFRMTRMIGIYPEVEDVNPYALKKSYGYAWTPRSKFIIIITRIIRENEAESIDRLKLEEILENFWSLDCLNVVLMTMPESEQNSSIISMPRLFSYDPFYQQNGGNERSEKRGRLLEGSSEKPFFPDKTNNLQGYPIHVSIFHQEPHAILNNYAQLGRGLHVSAVIWVSDWMNFTLNLNSAPVPASSYKVTLPDGRQVGPIGDVIKNRSDFLGNTIFVGALGGTRLEFLRPFARVKIAILVPRAGPMPGIIRVFRSLDGTFAIAIFVCSIFLACYLSARGKQHPFLNTYRLFVHQQMEGIGKKSSERIFWISWIIWAFVVSLALQSHLTKDMTDPPFYKSINSLAELASSDLTLMADPVNLRSINNSASETKNLLAVDAIQESDFAKCAKQLEEHGNVACAMDEAVIMEVARKMNEKYHKKNQWHRGIAHIVKEYLTDNWRTIAVKGGFPYLNKFDIAWTRMREMGFIKKWVVEGKRPHFEEASNLGTHGKLNMLHFEGPFKLLLIGHCLATLAFVVEIIFYQAKRRFSLNRVIEDADKLNKMN